ncbi:hypothetical protein ACXWOU_09515, partial [Streptococcus pyogenes]
PRFLDIESKVIQTLHFIRDYARFGKNPIVSDDTFKTLIEIQKLNHQIARDYIRWFFSDENACFLVPGQTEPTYDPYADAFLRCVV